MPTANSQHVVQKNIAFPKERQSIYLSILGIEATAYMNNEQCTSKDFTYMVSKRMNRKKDTEIHTPFTPYSNTLKSTFTSNE